MMNEFGIGEQYDLVDGKLVIKRSQDVQALIDQNRHEAQEAPSMFGQARVRKLGSIPFVIADQWSRECGAAIGSKEFAEYAKKKLMSGEFSAFKIKDA
jgi:hypothetical protein